MNSTPRLRPGRFPQTPSAAPQPRDVTGSPSPSPQPFRASYESASPPPSPDGDRSLLQRRFAPLPMAPVRKQANSAASTPLIPLSYLDAPTQRSVAVFLYAVLLSGRFVDYMRVGEEALSWWDSPLWKFLKWVWLDFCFLFGLPQFRVPWLELSQNLVLTLFAIHATFTFTLMFNVWPSFFLALVGNPFERFWDREISLSEHHVRASNILHNKSLIMGRQVINILPEGSATLNPDALPFCLDSKTKKNARLPIQFNASTPIEIELLRIDLDSGDHETLKFPRSEIRKIASRIKEESTGESTPTSVTWEYTVRKPGVYRLTKVLDEYKLEVQKPMRDTYVVPCPRAAVRSASPPDRCVRDLSDLSLEVIGTPPLKVGYSRMVNGKDHSFNFQSLQPDFFASPLLVTLGSQAVLGDNDISWVKPARVSVPLNESMTVSGEWRYTIAEVRDALGNVVKYSPDEHDADYNPPAGLEQAFSVKERPKARLKGCDPRNPLRVAKGRQTSLPLQVDVGADLADKSYEVTWDFSPADTLTNDGAPGAVLRAGFYSSKDGTSWPQITDPGLYTLRSISSNGCEGEIEEPSSCLLFNPLEPQLSLEAEEIPDKCAGSSVGFNVDLHLVGTPPFVVRYDVVTGNSPPRRERIEIGGLRHQVVLRPKEAGHHKYIFKQIDDAIYRGIPLMGHEMVLEQDVKPAASAVIQHESPVLSACLEEAVEVDILLLGDAPFALEWEIFYDGKRKTEKATGIECDKYTIKTPPLVKGGEYILTLNSIQDKSGCRTYLKESLKIAVRRQKPRVAFGMVEGARSITAVQGSSFRMPLRLQGQEEWVVSYRNLGNPEVVLKHRAKHNNDFLVAKDRGTWEIVGVDDDRCPGTVDLQASKFGTDWFPKPSLALVEVESIAALAPNLYEKQEICEGDVDGFEVKLSGNPPYHVGYQVRHRVFQGTGGAISQKEFDAALSRASVTVDSSKPGDYTYTFSALSDNLYDIDKDFDGLVLRQRVNAKPSASFVKPGQAFRYCQVEHDHEDKIPITLKGVAPFYVEIEVKHSSGTAPSTYRIPSIPSTSFNMQIPREHFRLGSQQVRIRKVRDARGCQQKYDIGGPSVQVNLYDAPSIYPLESRTDYCVGERIAYTLSGTPPFQVMYDFDGAQRRAKASTTDFRRIAESPGVFTIMQISDKASECHAPVSISRTIHPLPSVRISKGQNSRIDIHEGKEVDILFEFGGTPPFEFTYTRSTNARKGQRSVVLETRHDVSHEHAKIIRASQEGTYEVVAIKDKFCAVSTDSVVSKEKKQR